MCSASMSSTVQRHDWHSHISQLHHRFVVMKQVVEQKLSILNLRQPTVYCLKNQHSGMILQHEYENDLSPAYPLQNVQMMYCFRETMLDEIANLSSVHQQLAHMLIVENTSVPSGFADVGLVTALLLFLTLPVPVARQRRLRQDVFNEWIFRCGNYNANEYG